MSDVIKGTSRNLSHPQARSFCHNGLTQMYSGQKKRNFPPRNRSRVWKFLGPIYFYRSFKYYLPHINRKKLFCLFWDGKFLFFTTTHITNRYDLERDLRIKMQFPKLHFGPGLFDLERSRVKGKKFLNFAHHDLRQLHFGNCIFIRRSLLSFDLWVLSHNCHSVTSHHTLPFLCINLRTIKLSP